MFTQRTRTTAPVDSQASRPSKLYLVCERHARYYYSILSHVNQLYLKGGASITQGLRLFNVNWPNIKAGQKWASLQIGKADEAAELCRDYANAGMHVLSIHEHPNERILWLESAVTAARRLKDPLFEGRHLGNLGTAYYALARRDAALSFRNRL
jgi:hypothetical protein